MSYSTDQLLLAAKVLELSTDRQRKAAEREAIDAGISAEEVPQWMGQWLRKNPREQFAGDVLEELADIADFISRRSA